MLIMSSLTGEVKDANNICVKCPPGTYYRKVTKTVVSTNEENSVNSNTTATTEECGPCQPGTFQDKVSNKKKIKKDKVSQTINQLSV